MKTLMELTSALSRAMEKEGVGFPVKSGNLCIETDHISSSQEAMDRFFAFGGTGWLCHTGSPDVVRLEEGIERPVMTEGWPECAEAVKGQTSISLLPDGKGGWELTTLTVDDHDQKALLVTHRQHCRDSNDAMSYEVCWRVVQAAVGDHDELRPVACRFKGFVPLTKEE